MRTNFRSTYGCVQCGVEWPMVEKELTALRTERDALLEERNMLRDEGMSARSRLRDAEAERDALRKVVEAAQFALERIDAQWPPHRVTRARSSWIEQLRTALAAVSQ